MIPLTAKVRTMTYPATTSASVELPLANLDLVEQGLALLREAGAPDDAHVSISMGSTGYGLTARWEG